jgi:hypothetical protein
MPCISAAPAGTEAARPEAAAARMKARLERFEVMDVSPSE